MRVYVNYPNSRITIHRQYDCGAVQPHQTPDHRIMTVTDNTLGEVLTKFINREIDFAAQAGLNGLWLDLNLPTDDQERSLIIIIHALLGQRYRRLANAAFIQHC